MEDTVEQPFQTATQQTVARPLGDSLERHIQKARQALLAQQLPDGHWVFELEAHRCWPWPTILSSDLVASMAR